MNLEKALNQRSYLYFIAFFLFALIAFWLTYFTKLFDQANYRMHLHGIALVLWCFMLITQPYLIRTKRSALHKRVGVFSYVLVPVVLFTTVDLLKYKVNAVQTLATMDIFFIALVLNALVAFVVFYLLAILYKKNSGLHARLMVCTVFPMFTPVTDRIIHIYLSPMVKYLPTIEGNPIAPVVGFIIADLFLIGLIYWDWKSHKNLTVFPFALAVLLFYHYSVLNFYKFDFWKSFCVWFQQV